MMALLFAEEIDVRSVVLKKLKIGASVKIPMHMLENAVLEQTIDAASGGFILQLRTYVTAHHWTENLSQSEIVKVPLTWIDAVRLRFASKFMTRKFPIQYRVINTGRGEINNYWVFPEIPPHPNKNITDFLMAYTEQNSQCVGRGNFSTQQRRSR